MGSVAADAEAAGEHRLQGRALTALGEMALYQRADADEARRLIEQAGEVLSDDDDVDARFDVFSAANMIASWRGDLAEVERIGREALEFVREAGPQGSRGDRRSRRSRRTRSSRSTSKRRRRSRARRPSSREESGSVRARAAALGTQAWLSEIQGRWDEAERCYRELIQLYSDIGNVDRRRLGADVPRPAARRERPRRRVRGGPARVGADAQARRRPRAPLRGAALPRADARRARQGRRGRAARAAGDARRVGPEDQLSVWTTRMALGVVRAAQGRDAEAEQLLTRLRRGVRRQRPALRGAAGARAACRRSCAAAAANDEAQARRRERAHALAPRSRSRPQRAPP